LEFGVPKLCNLKADVEVQALFRTKPVVFTRLSGLRNDAKAFDHLTLNSFLIQKSLQKSNMVHNVPRDVVQFDTQGETTEVYVHYVLYIFVSLC